MLEIDVGTYHTGDREPEEYVNGLVVWRTGPTTGWAIFPPGFTALFSKDAPWYLDDLLLCWTQARMKRLQTELQTGQYVLDIDRAGGRYRLLTIDGGPTSEYRNIESIVWLDWLTANAERYLPEFATAMRAANASRCRVDPIRRSAAPRQEAIAA